MIGTYEEKTQNYITALGLSEIKADVTISGWGESRNPSFSDMKLLSQLFDLVNKNLEEKISEIIETKLNSLLEKKDTINFREISNIEAKREIINYIGQQHKNGIFKLNTLDLILELKLPALQVDKILNQYLKEGRIKEIR